MIDPFRSSFSGSTPFNGGAIDQLQHMQQPVFSLHSEPLPPLVSNVGASHNGGVEANTTLHMTVTEEVDAFDEGQLEKLRRTLQLLEGISQGRHAVDWKGIINPSKPVESAKNVSSMLARPTTLPSAIECVAKCITTPEHLSIVAKLDQPFRSQVRDAVLQELLNTLTTERDPPPMPVCSEMLAEMVQLNLVVLRGVSRTLETLLSDTNTRRAAIAVLGKLADRSRGDAVFARAVQNLEPLVRAINDTEYEYDRVAIARLLRWGGSEREASLVLERIIASQPQQCQVTSMAYIGQRDELASATCDGSVVIWGSPNAVSKEVRPATSIDLPQNYVPVALEAPPNGSYMVVAGMPISLASQQAMMKASGSGISGHNWEKKRQASPSRVRAPLLRFLTCNEGTGVWMSGDTTMRRENTALTAAVALPNMVVCTAESYPSERSSEAGIQHNLVLLNGCAPQPLGVFEGAHEDYITVLRVGDESGHTLFTGSRDCVVKMWDIRSNSTRSVFSLGSATAPHAEIPLHRLENAHTDTVTSIFPHRKVLLTASLDGNLLMWDIRQLCAPVHEMQLHSPILDVAPASGGFMVVSTARSLNLLSLETLKFHDIVPNVSYTQLRTNFDGRVMFGAGGTGVSVYSVRD
ncbi:WD domain [Trypanosoma brucei equiperdum]|uniref:WD domain n=1 Tax=Trypanosoma brucei equiperdum TaxID=630700 RepID=A0A3L6L441_9TRYP|nr:WD domain [Trypanosoma brucei equiperdum]